MKKNLKYILASCLLMFTQIYAIADTVLPGVPKMWTVPAVWVGDEEVTFYYDVTDVGFAPDVDLYLWAWQPTEPDAGNGGNSSDFAKLTNEGNNIYSITMVPTEYFHCDVSAFEDPAWPGMWQQVKTKNGEFWSTSASAGDNRLQWEAFKASGKSYQVFSGKNVPGYKETFTLTEPMTIVFNPDLFQVGGMSMTEYEKTAGFGSFNLHSGLNDWAYQQNVAAWVPENLVKTNISKLSNGFYQISMTSPFDYYSYCLNDLGNNPTGLEADTQIENLAWLVVGVNNGVWSATSPDMSTKAGTATPYPDPLFSIFPTRVSNKDILTLIRQWNESTAGVLSYTIYNGNAEVTDAGKVVATGTMDGIRDKRQGSVDLIKALNGANATQLHIVVTRENGMEVANTVIPLITPDTETNN